MKHRIVSILLVLCMVLSMLPVSVFAAEADHLTVLEGAPSAATVSTGDLYELDLSTVFADSEGHSLRYTLSGGDFGTHTKIQDGKLYFCVADAGTYQPTVTATCAEGATLPHTITMTVEAATTGGASQYSYDETNAAAVTVRVNLSNDGMPLTSSNGSDTVMAGLEVTVPYFDLSLYELQDYYRYHTENGQGSYVDAVVVERPTLLHLYIYLLERYYMGLPEAQCGKGTSGVLDYSEETDVKYFNGKLAYSSSDNRAGALSCSGAATSFFMEEFWGHDLNLKYYRNHMYPLMSAGWGSTADYILLSDGDVIDIGLFTSWEFYSNGEFCCFDQDVYTATAGSILLCNTLRWNWDKLEDYSGLCYSLYDATWKPVDTAISTNGSSVSVPLPTQPGTYYLLGMDATAGSEESYNAPAVATIQVTLPATAIVLDQTELELCVSSTATLNATLQPENSTDSVVWASTDATIADVENGIVTARSTGVTTITATAGSVSASCTVTVRTPTVDEVAALIRLIGYPVTLADEPAIINARAAYDLLSETDQKSLSDKKVWGTNNLLTGFQKSV